MRNRTTAYLSTLVLLVVMVQPLGHAARGELAAGTFFGGSGIEGWSHVPLLEAPDGTVYLIGNTRSTDLPTTPGAFDETHNGGEDIFIAHLDAGMTQLLHCTYLGGSNDDVGWPGVDALMNEDGTLYVVSSSISSNYPTTAGVWGEQLAGSYDVVVTHLSADLSTVLASTYLGGSGGDDYPKVTRHPSGDLLVTCSTRSTNFPTTTGSYDPANPGVRSLALARLTADLSTVVSATYLGSTGNDWPENIAATDDGRVYVVGWTRSGSFPTTDGAFQAYGFGGFYQAFVSCLDDDLTTLVGSTYLNGSGWEFCYGLVVDEEGSVYTSGHTVSTNFPGTDGGAQPDYTGLGGAGAGDDIFVAKLNADLTELEAATYLGGTSWENSTHLALVPGGILVGGITGSVDYPVTPDSFCPVAPAEEGVRTMVITRLSRDLSTIQASTYVGGSGNDNLGYLCVTGAGQLLVGGSTASANFPVADVAYDTDHNGGSFDYGGDAVALLLEANLTAGAITAVTGELEDPASGETPAPGLRLEGAWPNPFNPSTSIHFTLGQESPVRITVHDLAGRRVATLADRSFAAGHHAVAWDGCDDLGGAAASGTYLVRVLDREGLQAVKILLGK